MTEEHSRKQLSYIAEIYRHISIATTTSVLAKNMGLKNNARKRQFQMASSSFYHSGTIRGVNCDRNKGNTQHCSTCLFQYYTENAKCQSHRDTSAGIYWTLRSFKVQEWRNGGCVSQTWDVCELPPCRVGVPGEEDFHSSL